MNTIISDRTAKILTYVGCNAENFHGMSQSEIEILLVRFLNQDYEMYSNNFEPGEYPTHAEIQTAANEIVEYNKHLTNL